MRIKRDKSPLGSPGILATSEQIAEDDIQPSEGERRLLEAIRLFGIHVNCVRCKDRDGVAKSRKALAHQGVYLTLSPAWPFSANWKGSDS